MSDKTSPPTDTPPAAADDAPRVPVLAWRLDNDGNSWDMPRCDCIERSIEVGRHRDGTWRVYGAGIIERRHDTPEAAMVTAEDWMRHSLAPLAPLFATGGTDAE